MADTQRYWDGEKWTDHIAPANAPEAAARLCPYCTSSIPSTATRCPSCAGEMRFCWKCQKVQGMSSRQMFVGVLRGGMQTQYRCIECNTLLYGPRF